MISAYPLTWPAGWPRTPYNARKHGKFGIKKASALNPSWKHIQDITITEATQRLLEELGRMGITRDDIVISTNLQLRLDGLPRGSQGEPSDCGAAVYWETKKGERRVMAIDQYFKVADNLAAIAATLDAMRAIERHGGAQILDRAFTGFTALPAPTEKRAWREVMKFAPGEPVNAETARICYRKLAGERHPDKGGSHDAMVELNAAYDEAQQEIGSNP